MATFRLNVHQFDEALDLWHSALDRIQPSEGHSRDLIWDRINFTRFGQYSKLRDDAYQHGQGNILQAWNLTFAQSSIYNSPNVLFDRATLEVMLSEVNASMASAALHFGKCESGAQFAPALATLKPHSYGGLVPIHGHDDGDNGSGQVSLNLTYVEHEAHIHELANVYLTGPEAVAVRIYSDKNQMCTVWRLESSGVYQNLPRQLRILDLWSSGDGRPSGWDTTFGRLQDGLRPKRVASAASIVQYATISYFHFVMEVLPRLVLLRPLLSSSAGIHLIIPRITAKTPFILPYFQLFPEVAALNESHRLIEFDTAAAPNELLLKVDTLYLPDWPAVQHTDPTHCLAPAQLLRQVRSVIVEAFPSQAAPAVVIYYTRTADKMRRLENEAELVELLRASLVTPFELVIFDGKAMSIPETLRLFAAAAVVVGVHGGGLANVIACRESTLLVELGFRSPFTRHFAHAAMALGLSYHLELMQPDARSVGAETVVARPGSFERVAETVNAHLTRVNVDHRNAARGEEF